MDGCWTMDALQEAGLDLELGEMGRRLDRLFTARQPQAAMQQGMEPAPQAGMPGLGRGGQRGFFCIHGENTSQISL